MSARFSSFRLIGLVLGVFPVLPSCGSGGGGGGGGEGGDPTAIPDLEASEFHVTPAFGIPADGSTSAEILVRMISRAGTPMAGLPVVLEVSGYANEFTPLAATDEQGESRGSLRSRVGERKRCLARVGSGEDEVVLGPIAVVFLTIPPDTWFVRAEAGSDANSGRNPLEAWATVAHALATVGPGATVHVGAGLYTEPLEVTQVSSAEAPLRLLGDDTGCFTGDAGEVVIGSSGSPHGLQVAGAEHVVLRGLTVRGVDTGAGLRCVDSLQVCAFDVRFQENGTGVDAERTEGLVLEGCRISNNLGDGVRLGAARLSRVVNNLLYNNGECGLRLSRPSENSAISFNTFYSNGGDQLLEERAGGSGRIEDNILAEGALAGLALDMGTRLQLARNLVWANADDRSGRGLGGTGTIEGDPELVAPSGPDGILGGPGDADDDFRVHAGSLALDQGALGARDLVLVSREALSTFTTHAAGTLDGTASDLPATNIGFHYRGAVEPFESLAPGGARLALARARDVLLESRGWNRTDGVLPAARPLALNADIAWLEQRVSPLYRPDEAVAALVDTATGAQLLVRSWDGWRWSRPFDSAFSRAFSREDLADRPFDIEYEHLSGQLLLVSAGPDANPRYRELVDGRWSGEQPAFETPFGSGRILWMELVPRPYHDEIALVALTDVGTLFATVWTGATWSTPTLLEESTVHARGWRPFDVAWESLSGDLLVSWGFNVFIEETRWASFERAQGAWRFGQHPSADAIGADVHLAPDPVSDRIAAVMGEADFDDDVIVSLWNGGEWIETAELTLVGAPASHALDATWIGTTGQALVTYKNLGSPGSFNYAILRPTGWRIQPEARLPGVGRAERIVLDPLQDQGEILGLVLDGSGKLFTVRYAQGAFFLMNGGQPLASELEPSLPGRSFDLAARLP